MSRRIHEDGNAKIVGSKRKSPRGNVEKAKVSWRMKKDFQKWHREKSHIHHEKKRPFFHLREVWFCSLGLNVGFEQDGGGDTYLRPVLVLRKFNNEVLWVLPFTRHSKEGRYYFRIKISKNRTESTLILSQIRLIDAKRLQYKLGDISKKDFAELKKRLRALLE